MRLAATLVLLCVTPTGCGWLVGIEDIVYQTDGGTLTNDAADVSTRRDEDAAADAQAADDDDSDIEASPEADTDSAIDAEPSSDGGTCDPAQTSSDPHNCGACWHDCLGAGCTNGQCQPILLASQLMRPVAIAAPG